MPQIRPRVFKVEEAVSPIDADSYQPELPSETYRDEMPVLGSREIEVETEATVAVNLRLPKAVYDEYSRLAAAQELKVEEVLQHRLMTCISHNALRGLWFSDSERSQLENLIQKWPLESAAQFIALFAKAAAIKFDDIEITLTPAQKRFLTFRGGNLKNFFEGLIRKELRV